MNAWRDLIFSVELYKVNRYSKLIQQPYCDTLFGCVFQVKRSPERPKWRRWCTMTGDWCPNMKKRSSNGVNRSLSLLCGTRDTRLSCVPWSWPSKPSSWVWMPALSQSPLSHWNGMSCSKMSTSGIRVRRRHMRVHLSDAPVHFRGVKVIARTSEFCCSGLEELRLLFLIVLALLAG